MLLLYCIVLILLAMSNLWVWIVVMEMEMRMGVAVCVMMPHGHYRCLLLLSLCHEIHWTGPQSLNFVVVSQRMPRMCRS